MNERRKEFRRKMANIHNDAYDRSLEAALDRIEKVDSPNGPMIPVEDNMVAMYEALDAAAAAVYAQAIRDVLEMSVIVDETDYIPTYWVHQHVIAKGIDLSDPEEQS